MKNALKKAKKGFTLIEMLIVMAVVSILIAIIIPSYRGMQQDAWIAKAEKELQTLQVAVESFYRHNDRYPTTLLELTQASPKIITKLLDDPWKTETVDGKDTYGYHAGNVNGFGNYYIIYSKSIDGTDSTSGRFPTDGDTAEFEVQGDDIVLSNLPTK